MEPKKTEIKKDLRADVVIIGAGGSGLAAAVEAAENGANNVMILESREVPGGNTMSAMGLFAIGSPDQKQDDLINEVDDFFQKTMSYSHWKNNPRLVRALIEKSCEIVPWLEQQGIEFRYDGSLLPIPINYQIIGSGRGGATVVKALTKRCEELRVRLYYKTRAKKLLLDSSGKITGILAEQDDGQIKIATDFVIIATGGFAGNPELLKEYFPDYRDEDAIYLGGLPHQGDGLILAKEIGAATDGMVFLELSLFMFSGPMNISILAKDPTNIWVNRRGERFVNESIISPEATNSIYRQPGKTYYALFDEKIKKIHFDRALSPMDMSLVSGSWPDQAEKDLHAYAKKDRAMITDSWDEMAQWMGASPEELKATIDEYNNCCEAGHDTFLKDRKHLIPILTPPFYGIECGINLLVTHGDIKTNHQLEVLDKDEKPIPGLYAAGDDIGGVDSDTYNMNLPGHSFGFAINSGRIAGKNAAMRIARKE